MVRKAFGGNDEIITKKNKSFLDERRNSNGVKNCYDVKKYFSNGKKSFSYDSDIGECRNLEG